MNSNGLQIYQSLKSFFPRGSVLHQPIFGSKEYSNVKRCLDSTFVSSVGEFVDRFETALASFTKAAGVTAVVNGTSALHVALRAAGVSKGDEVFCPTISFVATANAVTYLSATPYFIDCSAESLAICPRALRMEIEANCVSRLGKLYNKQSGNKISALLITHVFGHGCDMDELIEVCEEFNLILIEDAAAALGSYFKGQHLGTFGKFGILSFNGNKIITTGGGGAVLSKNQEDEKYVRHLTTTAKVSTACEPSFHDESAYNYRLPNVNAAIGCAQLEIVDRLISAKRDLYTQYVDLFSSITGVTVLKEGADCRSNYWLQCLLIENFSTHDRSDLIHELSLAGIQCRPLWALLHSLPCFRICPRSQTKNAESFLEKALNIPSNLELGAKT